MRDAIELDNQDLEEAYNKGKSETIKDKKLVPIEKVLEIIEEMLNTMHGVSDYEDGFDCALISLKSKIGALAK